MFLIGSQLSPNVRHLFIIADMGNGVRLWQSILLAWTTEVAKLTHFSLGKVKIKSHDGVGHMKLVDLVT